MTLSGPSAEQPLTARGTVVGTFQYMAPEQVEGKEADARSDIFALGAVLYEMATGKRAFTGKTQGSIVAAILAAEPPPISTIQPMSPPALDRVVRNCIAKDPDDRFQSVHDLKLQLKWIAEGGSQAGIPSLVSVRRKGRERLAWMAALALVGMGAVLMGLWPRQPASTSLPIQSYLPAPENSTFILSDDDTAGPVVISPKGTYIAFVAMEKDGTKRIFIRALSESSAKPLTGAEGGTYPFWSPDEKWVGFFADGKLKKAPVQGGPALTLADAPRARGGSWGDNGMILFTPTTQSSLFEVSATGGTAQPVTKLLQGVHTTNRWPVWLPGSKKFLYLATSHEFSAASEHNGIYVASPDGRENRFLIPADANAVITPDHLLYVQNGTIMAQPFDLSRAELKGDPIPVFGGVIRNSGTWRAAFDVSQNGILVYQAGASALGSQLLWMSHDGKPPTQFGKTSVFGEIRLSPDGQKLAAIVGDPRQVLWIYDIARGGRTRLTFEGSADNTPVWSPDGKRVAFSHRQGAALDIYTKEVSGSGKEELLLSDKDDKPLSDWSSDGRYLLYTSAATVQSGAIWFLPLFGDRKPQQFLQGTEPGLIGGGVFSPDGKWVAYWSRESGRSEVYLTNFPQASGKWQVSTSGGGQPRWRRDGKALMYLSVDRTLMEAPISLHGDVVEIGTVHPYAKTNTITLRWGGTYDMAPDGRVLVNSTMGEDTRVVNWAAGIKK